MDGWYRTVKSFPIYVCPCFACSIRPSIEPRGRTSNVLSPHLHSKMMAPSSDPVPNLNPTIRNSASTKLLYFCKSLLLFVVYMPPKLRTINPSNPSFTYLSWNILTESLSLSSYNSNCRTRSDNAYLSTYQLSDIAQQFGAMFIRHGCVDNIKNPIFEKMVICALVSSGSDRT